VGISVRQEEINIMKYIGATDYLVRAPFVIEGILIGLLGAAIPLFVIYQMYNTVLSYMMERFTMLNELLTFLPADTIYDFLLPVSLLVGVGIGYFGSMITVRKHINV
jgi:cell division transport system permease protein